MLLEEVHDIGTTMRGTYGGAGLFAVQVDAIPGREKFVTVV